ncbi:glycosyltransferase [Synechococcus sp. HK01-R]|uniref:glycosyltransferase n=1 Tax=Synechococcus sp. HK01-R TaxID=2751171 RepID=UPI00210204D5|nr:glycosyltransferase [Synechococcus sp. HK01-R]
MSPNVTIDSIRVLVPGTGARFRCGGLSVALQTARLLGRLRPTELVTYRAREAEHSFLDDVLAQEASPGNALWLVSWGFDVPATLKKLRGRPVLYQAHSSGYGFDLPPGVPLVAVSRNTLGYWGDRAPRNPLFLVPNALEPQWLERGARPRLMGAAAGKRPIDVLVQQRKSSPYVLNTLVPALRARGLTVEVQSGWVDDLVALFNSASVYLYDSAEYWRGRGVSEGFGLPPLEALACGCVVFSSFNHALADTLTPGVSAHQIGQGSLSNDLERITAAAADPSAWGPDAATLAALLEEVSEARLLERWRSTLGQLQSLQANNAMGLNPAYSLRSPSTRRLRWSQRFDRLRGKVVNRLPGWLPKP